MSRRIEANSITVGIVGRKANVTEVFAESIRERGMSPQTFETISDLERSNAVNILIVSERHRIPPEMKDLPRIVIGTGEDGASARFLNGGAWDYISTSEEGASIKDYADYAAAKIGAQIRRSDYRKTESMKALEPITIEDIVIDLENKQLYVAGELRPLQPLPLIILIHLIKNRDVLVNRSELIDLILERSKSRNKRGYDRLNSQLNIYVNSIRKVLGTQDRDYVKSVKNKGYMFSTRDEQQDLNLTLRP